MLAKLVCLITGKHKFGRAWEGVTKSGDVSGRHKICSRCGLIKPIKSRQQKRDDVTKELTAKVRAKE